MTRVNKNEIKDYKQFREKLRTEKGEKTIQIISNLNWIDFDF